MGAGARLAKWVQTIVTRDQWADRFKVMHVIETPYGADRIGTYTVWMRYRSEGGVETETRHTFNIQLLLDMRDTWKDSVEKKTLALMKEVVTDAV